MKIEKSIELNQEKEKFLLPQESLLPLHHLEHHLVMWDQGTWCLHQKGQILSHLYPLVISSLYLDLKNQEHETTIRHCQFLKDKSNSQQRRASSDVRLGNSLGKFRTNSTRKMNHEWRSTNLPVLSIFPKKGKTQKRIEPIHQFIHYFIKNDWAKITFQQLYKRRVLGQKVRHT